MNSVRRIQELNKKELEHGFSTEASWHADYRDTAYIYIGGLPLELSEGDIITIFSQFGEPTFLDLVRDKETGKSRGFAFLKYEDQRSTDLAVDNLGGAVILGRTLNVDHTRYQKRDEKAEDGKGSLLDISNTITTTDDNHNNYNNNDMKDDSDLEYVNSKNESLDDRPKLKEEQELEALLRDLDDEDPMKSYFIQEKREQVALALAKHKGSRSHKASHRNRSHHHRSRRNRSHSRSLDDNRDPRNSDRGRHSRRE